MSNIKLNIFKKLNHETNDSSISLIEDLKSNDNLKKIRWTTKTLESKDNNKPYLSYQKDNNEKKIYDFKEINQFLNKMIFHEENSTLVYDYMME